MSSDNGIYVLASPCKNSKEIEYRVAHGSAIENIDYYPVGSDQYKAMEVMYFGQSEVYDTEKKARKAAKQLENGAYTEYGICLLPMHPKPFPNMTQKEAEKIME